MIIVSIRYTLLWPPYLVRVTSLSPPPLTICLWWKRNPRDTASLLWSFTALPTFVKTPANIKVSVTDRQVLLSCLATGHPTPDILWWKDGEPLRQDHWHIVSKEGTLKIIDPKIDDEGNYECVAQNSAGEVVSKAVLNYYGVKGWLWIASGTEWNPREVTLIEFCRGERVGRVKKSC